MVKTTEQDKLLPKNLRAQYGGYIGNEIAEFFMVANVNLLTKFHLLNLMDRLGTEDKQSLLIEELWRQYYKCAAREILRGVNFDKETK